MKKLLLTAYAESFEDQVAREARLISECAESADGKEGVAAFLGKRRPEFA